MTVVAGEFVDDVVPHNARAIVRADDDFLVRKIDFVCGGLMGGDFLRAYIWNTISVLNVRHLTHSDANFKYAALYAVPPDSERRPVSVQTLAKTTRLPYETVRRQTLMLERDGLCARVAGQGIVIQTATFEKPQNIEIAKLVFAAVQRLVEDLKRSGFAFGDILRSPRGSASDPQSIVRAVVRLDGEYILDVLDILRPHHNDDPIEAVIFTAIETENTRHLAPNEYGALDAVAPDALRRPVSVLAGSHSMQIPYETLRRMMNRMARAGKLVRVKDGFIVPAGVQMQLTSERVLGQRHARLKRFVSDLQFVGLPLPA